VTIPVRVGVALDPLADFAPDRWRARVDALEELGVDSIWLPDAVTLRGLAVPSSPGCARSTAK
jgi:alkanesulfonate monooxygenase SsuD/methylene tetrahydromethanopterin reductase-like flavin-dependent oxidoreductase (luciferase family)